MPDRLTAIPASEHTLLTALAQSDAAAFTEIYDRYWQLLLETAYQRLGDQDQAMDVVQDVFVKLWDQRETLDIQHLRAYLQTAVRYRVYNLIALQKVNDTYFKYLSLLDQSSGAADYFVLYTELEQQFKQILEQMPEKRREVFDLRHVEGLSTKEIAAQLNITQKTVQNQLIKALDSIREILTALLILLINGPH
ncbi:RNA polymerase subunit sigma-24 [Siphonobacter sp. BAB-5385]|uniref:RNA polymerase sigma-70 factor n=1 Tax=Siphonobacter sp. BAB-5385 TaxID=1864822 RepID=UPI000B9E3FC2|nr:RNA polymerase sigma-70 factor [Siphonobacter sp. BAB-5385]OZI05838.1 RNA polymerase subunit sigma-24 [Siphonobacter sp. BAB-5385]